MHVFQEFVDKLIAEEALSAEQKDEFKVSGAVYITQWPASSWRLKSCLSSFGFISQEYVKEQVRAAKKANREVKYNHAKMNDIYILCCRLFNTVLHTEWSLQAREARKKAIEDMSEETKQAFQSMKFYKFYPQPSPETPDVSGVKVRTKIVHQTVLCVACKLLQSRVNM